MKLELQKKLMDKYPKIFAQKDLPMSQTAMCWGIDCGDGWYWILDMLCGTIQSYCDNRNSGVKLRNEDYAREGKPIAEAEWQVEATQVKEKFGGLRFYITSGDDEIYGMIDLAEHMSYHTCEQCGNIKTAKVRGDGWIYTFCDKCWKKHRKDKKGE